MTKKNVFLTGASGVMGGEALKRFLERSDRFHITVLNLPDAASREVFKQYEHNRNITIVWGDLTNYQDVLKCVSETDYVIHCAAFVSPASDRFPHEAMRVNYRSTSNIIKAILAQPNADQIKFVNIGTVAQTGDRMPPIHWGRVGDPINPSVHDYYAVSKVATERAVVESGIKHWVSLRQTGMASPKAFCSQEGIVFHQPMNNVLEWVTAHDAGVLCANICEDWVDERFWGHIYNIGGGASCRLTAYEILSKLMAQIGIDDIRQTCEPNWYATHNFHGQWYSDSDKLEDFLHFRSQSMDDHIREYGITMRGMMQSEGAHVPATQEIIDHIRKANEQIALSDTGTLHWLIHDKSEFIDVSFISKTKWAQIPGWDKYVLYSPLKTPDVLNHGYDETKEECELTLDVMKEAAVFRGGRCNSTQMTKGDWRTKLDFSCAFGHTFSASPRLVLEGGHWCDECERASWNCHEVAKRSPFFAQVWYPLHEKDEVSRVYPKIVKETDIVIE